MSENERQSVFALRQQVMDAKNEREAYERHIAVLRTKEQELRTRLQNVCKHETTVSIRADVRFWKHDDRWDVESIVMPTRLCCACGLAEISVWAPGLDVSRLRTTLLRTRIHPEDLVECHVRFSVLVAEPAKRISHGVHAELRRRDDLRDPLVLAPYLLTYAPTWTVADIALSVPSRK